MIGITGQCSSDIPGRVESQGTPEITGLAVVTGDRPGVASQGGIYNHHHKYGGEECRGYGIDVTISCGTHALPVTVCF